MKFQVFHVNPGEKLKKKMLIMILAILCQSFLICRESREYIGPRSTISWLWHKYDLTTLLDRAKPQKLKSQNPILSSSELWYREEGLHSFKSN